MAPIMWRQPLRQSAPTTKSLLKADRVASSVLFDAPPPQQRPESGYPPYFRDLNLDQLVDGLAASRPWLKATFNVRLQDVESVRYRQDVVRDLQDEPTYQHLSAFVASMRATREQLARAESSRITQQKQRWFIDGVCTYCSAASTLARLSRT